MFINFKRKALPKLSLLSFILFSMLTVQSAAAEQPQTNPKKNSVSQADEEFARPVRSKKGPWASGQILVIPRAGVAEERIELLVKKNGGGKARKLGNHRLRVVEVKAGDEEALIERLLQDEDVEFAELDREISFNSTNDPSLASQWHLPKINAISAWSLATGQNVVVAIADTGVDPSHPDLKDRLVAGYNFYDNNTDSRDVQGHGTNVAGTTAATMNNGIGVASVAGNAMIMPLRIASPTGSSYMSTVARAITYAADNGARIINVSFSGLPGSASVVEAAKYMKSKGGVVVVSGGNTGTELAYLNSDAMIAVAGTDSNDARAWFSSTGVYIDIAAPGVNIFTTANGGGYGAPSGTSFASPIVAGVVALMTSANPNLTPDEIQNILFSTAEDRGLAGYDKEYGWGRVNAFAAVQAAVDAGDPVDVSPPVVTITKPVENETVMGVYNVAATASDNIAVSKVELWVNGIYRARDLTAPYLIPWYSNEVANGSAQIEIRAFDEAGNMASAVRVVNVANQIGDVVPPKLTISNLQEGSILPDTIKVDVRASDDQGNLGLEITLFIDGVQVAKSLDIHYLVYRWVTRKLKAGPHEVRAVATDRAGNITTYRITVIK